MLTFRSPLVQRRLFVLVIIILLFAQSALVPFRHSFRIPCHLEPVTVWKLKYDGAGQVTGVWEKSCLKDEIRYVLFQLDRPDIANIRLENALHEGSVVKKGDVLGWVNSRELGHTLKITRAELKRARASEIALRAGSRRADIAVETENLKSAEVALAAYEPEFQRVRRLFADSLVSLAEFQQAEGQFNILTAARSLAAAKVSAAEAGSRAEDVEVAEAEVQRLEEAVDRAQNLLGRDEPILAPFDGCVRLGGETDVLLTLLRTDTLDATLVMPETYGALIQRGKIAGVQLYALPGRIIPAPIEVMEYLSGDSLGIRAHAYLPNPDGALCGGMCGYGEILSDRITLLESLRVRFGRQSPSWRF